MQTFLSLKQFVWHSLLNECLLLLPVLTLSFVTFLHSYPDIAPFHSRRCDSSSPVGSADTHWLLGAGHRSAFAHWCVKAGVLDSEDRLSTLVFRTHCDRQDCHSGHDGSKAGRPSAGVCCVDPAHLWLREGLCSGASAKQPRGPAEDSREEERGLVIELGGVKGW